MHADQTHILAAMERVAERLRSRRRQDDLLRHVTQRLPNDRAEVELADEGVGLAAQD
jgi:hypothetical protein